MVGNSPRSGAGPVCSSASWWEPVCSSRGLTECARSCRVPVLVVGGHSFGSPWILRAFTGPDAAGRGAYVLATVHHSAYEGRLGRGVRENKPALHHASPTLLHAGHPASGNCGRGMRVIPKHYPVEPDRTRLSEGREVKGATHSDVSVGVRRLVNTTA